MLRNGFELRYAKIAELARRYLQTSSRNVWTCDPLHYDEGKVFFCSFYRNNWNFLSLAQLQLNLSYISRGLLASHSKDDASMQVTNFLSGYVDNEINLNQDSSCWNTCADYNVAQHYRCSDGTFCDQQRRAGRQAACDGTVIDCSYIDSSMTICQSVSEDN